MLSCFLTAASTCFNSSRLILAVSRHVFGLYTACMWITSSHARMKPIMHIQAHVQSCTHGCNATFNCVPASCSAAQSRSQKAKMSSKASSRLNWQTSMRKAYTPVPMSFASARLRQSWSTCLWQQITEVDTCTQVIKLPVLYTIMKRALMAPECSLWDRHKREIRARHHITSMV